jgi:hypothetical protein
MRRSHAFPDQGHGDPTGDLIRAVLATPGLDANLATVLEVLGDRCSSSGGQRIKALDIVQSGAVTELISCLREEYGGGGAASQPDRHHLVAKQRGLKLQLLTQLCGQLLPDLKSSQLVDLLELICLLLRWAASGVGGANSQTSRVRPEEQHLVLSLFGVFLGKCAERVAERLGEVLGYLAVLADIHSSSQEGVSLVPTNLPHLHFTPTSTTQQPDGGKRGESSSSCPETSESDYSDSDMMNGGEADYRQTSSIVEKTALLCLNTIVKKCPKKDVVSFWYVFLPDRCFCPLSAGVADLLIHPAKRIRQLAVSILVGRLG